MRERTSVFSMFLLALLLRLYGIERESLWLDEIGQVVVAQNSWWQTIVQAGHHAGNAPLDYLVTHFMLLFGQSEGILRLAPALWGALSVVLTYLLGKSVFDRAVGYAGALMLTFTPIHVYYSREVRFYSLVVLLALATMWAFQWALRMPTAKRRWLLYGVIFCLGLYGHYYMAVIAGVQGIWLAVKVWRSQNLPRQTFWYFADAAGCAVILFLPWIVYDNVVLQNSWGDTFRSPSFNYLFSAPFSQIELFPSRRQGSWLLAAGMGCAASLVLIVKDRLKSKQNQYALLFLSTFCVGTIAALTLDYLTGYFFAHRQLLIYTPLLLLVIAYGGLQVFRALRSIIMSNSPFIRLPDGLAIVVMVGFMVFTLWLPLRSVYTVEQRENWRTLSRYLLQHTQKTDLIIAPCTYCIEYYSPELAQQIVAPLGSMDTEQYDRIWFFDPTHLPASVQSAADLDSLEDLSPSHHFRLYVIRLRGDDFCSLRVGSRVHVLPSPAVVLF